VWRLGRLKITSNRLLSSVCIDDDDDDDDDGDECGGDVGVEKVVPRRIHDSRSKSSRNISSGTHMKIHLQK